MKSQKVIFLAPSIRFAIFVHNFNVLGKYVEQCTQLGNKVINASLLQIAKLI